MAGFPLHAGFGLDIVPFRSGVRTIATENGESAACCIVNGTPLKAFLASETDTLMTGRLSFARLGDDVQVLLKGSEIGSLPLACFREAVEDALREAKEAAFRNRFLIQD